MNKKRTAALLTGTMILSALGTVSVMADDLYFVTGGPMGTYYAIGQVITDVLNPLLQESSLTGLPEQTWK